MTTLRNPTAFSDVDRVYRLVRFEVDTSLFHKQPKSLLHKSLEGLSLNKLASFDDKPEIFAFGKLPSKNKVCRGSILGGNLRKFAYLKNDLTEEGRHDGELFLVKEEGRHLRIFHEEN